MVIELVEHIAGPVLGNYGADLRINAHLDELVKAVQRFKVVDNSDFIPNRLTVTISSPYPFL